MLRNKTFAPEFYSLISKWFDLREQAPGANLLNESVSGASSLVCTQKFACCDMTCLQLANQIGLFFSPTTHCEPQSGCFTIQLPRRVLRVYWLGYLPGSVFRESVSGASSLVCTDLYASFVLSKLPACIHNSIYAP